MKVHNWQKNFKWHTGWGVSGSLTVVNGNVLQHQSAFLYSKENAHYGNIQDNNNRYDDR